jgi:hypothetical protein
MPWPFPSGYNRYVYIAATTCALGGLLFKPGALQRMFKEAW